MEILQNLGFALSASFASGLNLYATISTLGLLHRLEIIRLPSSLEILAHPLVLGIALVLYLIEFVADKVPYLDNIWDAFHTFIRPPAAAVLAYSALGEVPEVWRAAAALLSGAVALTSHGTKATTRAAANTSPEPVSNTLLSLGEDGLAITLAWLAAAHPVVALVTVGLLVALSIYVISRLFRLLLNLWRRLFTRKSGTPARA